MFVHIMCDCFTGVKPTPILQLRIQANLLVSSLRGAAVLYSQCVGGIWLYSAVPQSKEDIKKSIFFTLWQ